MNKSLLTFGFFFLLCLGSFSVKAQLLLEENFDYTAGAPLVAGAVVSSDNSATSTTGWLTQSNSKAATNSYNISANGLSYSNYAGSGKGNALNILDNDGQDVFKSISKTNTTPTAGDAFPGPKTIYVAFMINVPAEDKDGAEYFAAIKISNSATDMSYMGRISAKVSGKNVQFGISKSTTPANTWSGDYPVATTHLLVMKYTMGGLNGISATDETNKYDDKVDLYINPTVGSAEPATATLHYENIADKDAYRYGSTGIIGGLAAMYFRTPGPGAIPASTIDGIRIGTSWTDVVAAGTTEVSSVRNENQIKIFMDQSQKQLKVNLGNNSFNQYEIYSITGSKMAGNRIIQNNFTVDLNSVRSGIYIVKMVGASATYSSKILVQ